jgi:hypothetical protein
MSVSTMTNTRSQDTFVRVVVVIAGISYLLAGLALVLIPEWFFNNIGYFPPFNHHYAGDLGMFQIPMGIGLLLAVRDPARHRLLIGVATVGSILHIVNHLYDDLGSGDMAHLLKDAGPLVLLAVLMLVALYILARKTP